MAGTPNLKQYDLEASPQIPIKAIHIHENYKDPPTKHIAPVNDICIIELESHFNITDEIQVVQMASNETNLNTQCYISGWGLNEVGCYKTITISKNTVTVLERKVLNRINGCQCLSISN